VEEKRHEPVHCIDPRAKYMIGKEVLYAQNVEDLGTYGKVEGMCIKSGKFIVKTYHSNRLILAAWVVEHA
jgi:hypothetical protein